MKGRVFSFVAVILLISWSVIVSPGSAQARCAAAARVQQAAADLMRAGRSGSQAALKRALNRHVDMRRVMNFALGRGIRKLRGKRRTQYYNRASAYAVRKLARLARSVRGERVRVLRCNGRRVVTRLLPQGEKIIWKLRGGRIVDVNFRGVWVAQILRSQFRRLLRESDNDMQVFLARLN